MSQKRLAANEIQVFQEALKADSRVVNIRLREGEYQYTLAKTIAAFQLEFEVPDVKQLIRTLYGQDKMADIQFVRKIQTILKKMEKSGLVNILPKKKPWDLQRYALSSFKFQDVDRNQVVFATDEQVSQSQDSLKILANQGWAASVKTPLFKTEVSALVATIVGVYIISIWALTLTVINPVAFVLSFSVAIILSMFLGRVLSETNVR